MWVYTFTKCELHPEEVNITLFLFYETGIDLIPERKEILKNYGVREFVLKRN
jgi:hypothetical protein